MEIIIVIAVLGVVAYWAYQTMNREKPDGSHPLDGPTTPKTSWPFPGGEVGEGKIHVKVADVAPGKSEADRVEATAPKCGCGRSSTGFCVGLHKLTAEEWAVSDQNPDRAPVAEAKPAKKPAAKKTADRKPAAKKAPAKKKST